MSAHSESEFPPAFHPSPAVQLATRAVFPPSAPLLEEERDLGAEALFPNLANPLRIHRAGMRAALAADDDPVDSVEVDPSK